MIKMFSYFAAHDIDVDTGGEFRSGADRLEPGQDGAPQTGVIPSLRRPGRIRHQCHCWVWAWDRVLDVGPGRIRAVWLDDKGGYPILADVLEGPAPEEAGD